MRQEQNRRRFLQASLGCAAPLLLASPVGKVAVFAGQVASNSGDPVLDFLRAEARRTYRRVGTAVRSGMKAAGEDYRATASHLALLEAYLHDKGEDARFDQTLRQRVELHGHDVAVAELSDTYRRWRGSFVSADGIQPPAALDLAAAGAALGVLHGKGMRWTLRALRAWTLNQGRLADQADALRPVAIPVASRQKPGDDFLGYSEQADWTAINCGNVGNLINALWVGVAFFGMLGGEPVAGVASFVVACLQWYAGQAC